MNNLSQKTQQSYPSNLRIFPREPLKKVRGEALARQVTELSGDQQDSRICLTFDDGPDPAHTPRILDVLAEYKIRASFFVLGAAAEQFPHLIERIINEGHTLGNHTHSHPHPWLVLPQRARAEVSQATECIRKIAGYAPRWFRPPHGRLRKAMLDQARLENMTTVLWNHSVIDWGPLGTDAGIAQRLREVKAGDIVLLHDGARQHNRPELTARQLPRFIESLLQKNIQPVALDQVA